MTRLIDATALKEYMDRPFWEKWEWEFICKAIDNAPTVKIDTNDIEYKAYCKGLEDGKKIATPKGEWIGDEEYASYQGSYEVYKCSSCGFRLSWRAYCNADVAKNFCPNCGAKMLKGGAE